MTFDLRKKKLRVLIAGDCVKTRDVAHAMGVIVAIVQTLDGFCLTIP